MVHVKIDDNKGIEATAGSGFEIGSDPGSCSGFSPYRLASSASNAVGSSFTATAPGLYYVSGNTALTCTLPTPSANPGALWIFTNDPGGGAFFLTCSSRVLSSQPPFAQNALGNGSTGFSTLKAGNGVTAQAGGSIGVTSDGVRYLPTFASGVFQIV